MFRFYPVDKYLDHGDYYQTQGSFDKAISEYTKGIELYLNDKFESAHSKLLLRQTWVGLP